MSRNLASVLVTAVFILQTAIWLPASAKTQVPVSRAGISLSFAPVVKMSAPSVVNIYAKRVVATATNPFANDPFFSDFFKQFDRPTARVQNSLGSGVVLSQDGLVVSNYHVVGGATEIRVVLSDRREFDADVLLADEVSDLAVMKLKDAQGLAAMPLRSSDEIEVGDLVLAIGNPFGVGQTVSSGIISGLARSGGATGDARAYFIQTDAPINPGNSGGALVDMSGALVGINTSILTRSGGSNGIGFAIPADLVAAYLKQARAGNRAFVRPWAGMIGQVIDSNLAEGLALDRPEGMVIAELHRQSPFAKAGLKPGDVVVRFNGRLVNGPAELFYHMSVLGTGADAQVEYLTDGRLKQAHVAMIAPPEEPARDERILEGQTPFSGMTIVNINPATGQALDLPFDAQGVAVADVQGLAARFGFQPGDVLVEVNGRKIGAVPDMVEVAGKPRRRWDITILRNGQLIRSRIQG